MLGQTSFSDEKTSLPCQVETQQAALSHAVASQRNTRFLWTGLGFTVLMLIGLSACVLLRPLALHASAHLARLPSEVAFNPMAMAGSDRARPSAISGIPKASHPAVAADLTRRAMIAGVVGLTIARPDMASADTVVPKNKVGVTPGGVRYFDKDTSNTCSPFNPCTPQKGDIVKIKYKSFLSNGQMYDSSEGPGRKPLAAKYKMGQMIAGWEEALETMKMGQTRIIQVPADMAYGEKGIQIEDEDGEMEYLVKPGERLQFELTLEQVALPPP